MTSKRIGWWMGATVAVMAVGYGAGVWLDQGTDTPSTALAKGFVAPSHDASSLATVADYSADEAKVYAMHWASDDELWYLTSAPDEMALVRLNTRTSESARWPLSIEPLQTPHTYLAAGPDDTLWVGVGYSVIAFDTKSEAVLATLPLDLEDSRAISGALDKGNPSPGTWITGLMQSPDGDMLMLRNNVLGTFRLRADGVEVAEELDTAPHGFQLVDGRPVAYRFDGDGVRFLGKAAPESGVGPRLGASLDGCGVAGDVADGSALLRVGDASSSIDAGIEPREPVAAVPGFVALGASIDGSVLRLNCSSGVVDTFSLGGVTVVPDGGGASLGPAATEESDDYLVETVFRPFALALSETGRLAIATDAGLVQVAEPTP